MELARQQPMVAQRRVTMNVPRPPWPLLPGSRDRDLIFLYNLLDNGLKFTRSGDAVQV